MTLVELPTTSHTRLYPRLRSTPPSANPAAGDKRPVTPEHRAWLSLCVLHVHKILIMLM